MKLTTDRHKAECGLSGTAEFLVLVSYMIVFHWHCSFVSEFGLQHIINMFYVQMKYYIMLTRKMLHFL